MKVSAAVAAALMFASPSGGTGAGADQAATPAPGGGSAGSIQPGQWEMTARVVSIEMPGAPPALQEQIRSQSRRADTSRTCITPEQAANPLNEFQRMATSMPGQTCQISENVFSAGVIRFAMTCQASGEAPSSTRMSMTGQYAATSIDVSLAFDVENPGEGAPGQTLRMRSSLTGRRLGDCPPAPPAPPAAPAPTREN